MHVHACPCMSVHVRCACYGTHTHTQSHSPFAVRERDKCLQKMDDAIVWLPHWLWLRERTRERERARARGSVESLLEHALIATHSIKHLNDIASKWLHSLTLPLTRCTLRAAMFDLLFTVALESMQWKITRPLCNADISAQRESRQQKFVQRCLHLPPCTSCLICLLCHFPFSIFVLFNYAT